MATATFSRKRVLDAAQDMLTYLASTRSAQREDIVQRLTAPRHVGFGFFRIMPSPKAYKIAKKKVPDYRYQAQEERIRAIYSLALAAKGDVSLSNNDVDDLGL